MSKISSLPDRVRRELDETGRILKAIEAEKIDSIIRLAGMIAETFKRDGKLVLFGNGGSAADAQHIAAEFIGRFQAERNALPAIALTTNTSVITALGNDYGFETVFRRQVEALVTGKDIVVAISTSGNSPNVIQGIRAAREKGAVTVALTGGDGGRLAGEVDLAIVVPSQQTPHIQEGHIIIGHIICGLVEDQVTGKSQHHK